MPKVKNTIMVDGKRKVCRIFDNGGASFDRYTIAFKGYKLPHWRGLIYPYLACNAYPFDPQGFGQHGEGYSYITGRDIGKRIAFETLPIDVQTFILNNI
jgi:hypothetical protein